MNPLLFLSVLWGAIAAAQAPALDRRIESLRECDRPATQTPTSWPVFAPEGTRLSIRTPPEASHRDDMPGCVHGCETWTRRSLIVRVTRGAFGPESFEDDAWKSACVTTRTGLRAVELREPSSRAYVLWPVPPDDHGAVTVSTADFVVAVSWVEDADREDALRVIDSLQRRQAP